MRKTSDDRGVPNYEVRNRLRIAHQHAAAAIHRTATLHEEAAGFWEQVHEPDRAEEHWQAAARYAELAKEHELQAQRFSQPSSRESRVVDG
jgi:hypothetical protein